MADVLLEGEAANSRRALKRKRIRRLVDLGVQEERRKRFRGINDDETTKTERCSKRVFVTCVLISISLLILLSNISSEFDLVSKFLNNYQEHYQQIVHGNRNHCKDQLDVADIFSKVRKHRTILHQEKALEELQFVLETSLTRRRKIPIALVGPVGVGKKLFIHSFLDHFPWPENVYSYLWNNFEHRESEKYHNLRVFIEQFSDCGLNLLIIKNLTPVDKNLVETVIHMLSQQKARQKRVIVFFVFYLNTLLSETEYLEQHNSLQSLNHTKTINFRSFTKKELGDCIRLELKLENMTVSLNTFDELMDTIDVKRSGCKNVYAKIMAFAKKVHDPRK